EAANSLMVRSKKWSALRAWGIGIAKRRGHRRAIVAVARKLAMGLHRMWLDGTEFPWTRGGGGDGGQQPAAGRGGRRQEGGGGSMTTTGDRAHQQRNDDSF